MLGTLMVVWVGGLVLVGAVLLVWSFRREPPEDFVDIFVRVLVMGLCAALWPVWLAAFAVAGALWGLCWARRSREGQVYET